MTRAFGPRRSEWAAAFSRRRGVGEAAADEKATSFAVPTSSAPKRPPVLAVPGCRMTTTSASRCGVSFSKSALRPLRTGEAGRQHLALDSAAAGDDGVEHAHRGVAVGDVLLRCHLDGRRSTRTACLSARSAKLPPRLQHLERHGANGGSFRHRGSRRRTIADSASNRRRSSHNSPSIASAGNVRRKLAGADTVRPPQWCKVWRPQIARAPSYFSLTR